jgi:hypothetical protein
MGELAAQPDGQPAPVCLRHGACLTADHAARARLNDALRSAAALLQDHQAGHRLARATPRGVSGLSADIPSAERTTGDLLIHALGLLDGRIHHNMAGAADDSIP